MTFSCYVYYRLDAGRVADAEAAVRAAMRELAQHWHVEARLAKKVGEPLLWMEIYEGIVDEPGPFIAALKAKFDCEKMRTLLAMGETRHLECFECA